MKRFLLCAAAAFGITLAAEAFLAAKSAVADPAGCCEQRANVGAEWAKNNLNFASCEQLNRALDNDDIFQPNGQVWWNSNCK